MKRAGRIAAAISLAAAIALALVSVALAQAPPAVKSTSQLTDEANAALASGNYATAISVYGEIRDRLNDQSLKASTEAKIADAYLKSGDAVKAGESLDRAFGLDPRLTLNREQYSREFFELFDLARVKIELRRQYGGNTTPPSSGSADQTGQSGGSEWSRFDQATVSIDTVQIEPVNPYYIPLDSPPRAAGFDLIQELPLRTTHVLTVHVDEKGKVSGGKAFWSDIPEINAEIMLSTLKWKFKPPPAKRGVATRARATVSLKLTSELKVDRMLEVQQRMPRKDDPLPTLATIKPMLPSEPPAETPGFTPLASLDRAPAPEKFKVSVDDHEIATTYSFLVYIDELGQVKDFRWLKMGQPGVIPWLEASARAWRWTAGKSKGVPMGAWTQISLQGVFELKDFEELSVEALGIELP